MTQRLNLRRMYLLFLHLALILLTVQVFLLSTEVSNLRVRMQGPTPLAIGDKFTLDGLVPFGPDPFDIGNANGIVLFVFTRNCQFCVRNKDAWNSLASHVSSMGIAHIGVSLDIKDSSYLGQLSPTYPIYGVKDPDEFKQVNGIRFVPQTVLLRSDRTIKYFWEGVLTQDYVEELLQEVNEISGHP